MVVIFTLLAASTFIQLLVATQLTWHHLLVGILGAGFTGLAVIQVKRGRVSPVLEQTGFGLGLILFFHQYFRVVENLVIGAQAPLAMSSVVSWLTVIYIATFLLFAWMRAVFVSTAVLFAVTAYAWYRFEGLAAPAAKLPFLDLFIAGVIAILLLSFVKRLTVLGLRAQARARELRHLALHDPLTGLYNRRYLEQALASDYSRASRYQQGLSVAIFDLDFFKQVNDHFSHRVGDEVLRAVADILRCGTRHGDTVARYGGEEFVIVFPETSVNQASVASDALRRAVEGYPWASMHPELKVTVSIGLSDDLSLGGPEAMLHAADLKLYQAKHSGKNQVCA